MLKQFSIISLLIIVIAGYYHFKSDSIDSYCSDIEIGADINQVLTKATELKFIVPSYDETNTVQTLVITNHLSPFFRLGCFLEIDSNVVIGKEFHAAD